MYTLEIDVFVTLIKIQCMRACLASVILLSDLHTYMYVHVSTYLGSSERWSEGKLGTAMVGTGLTS